jgi:thiosulfate dehydrogenase
LWGKNSFNTAAGLYRLGHMAAFVYHNMPQGRTQNGKAALSVAAAWDLAAYVNSQARPVKHFAGDWPQLKKKPKDLPFGPYADSLSESQHKYGPWLK